MIADVDAGLRVMPVALVPGRNGSVDGAIRELWKLDDLCRIAERIEAPARDARQIHARHRIHTERDRVDVARRLEARVLRHGQGAVEQRGHLGAEVGAKQLRSAERHPGDGPAR